MSWNLSYCSFIKAPSKYPVYGTNPLIFSSHIEINVTIQAVQSSWLQSCQALHVGVASTFVDNQGKNGQSTLLKGLRFPINNTCESTNKFVSNDNSDRLPLDFSSTQTIPLASDDITGRNYLNQLYEYFEQTYVLNLVSYVRVFEYNQPCPVCNDPHTMGDFLTLCYANCTSNTHPYIFDNTFQAYTETQCHPTYAPSIIHSTSVPTPTATSNSSRLQNNALLMISLLLLIMKIFNIGQ